MRPHTYTPIIYTHAPMHPTHIYTHTPAHPHTRTPTCLCNNIPVHPYTHMYTDTAMTHAPIASMPPPGYRPVNAVHPCTHALLYPAPDPNPDRDPNAHTLVHVYSHAHIYTYARTQTRNNHTPARPYTRTLIDACTHTADTGTPMQP